MMLPAALTHDPAAGKMPKVRLTGFVAGVEACQLVTNQPRMIVGSAADCDLVVMDPLVPPRALTLRHEKQHAGVRHTCGTRWILEAHGDARVYLNGDRVVRARIAPGDRIALGCHEIHFGRDDRRPRDSRSNVAVSDVCKSLLAGSEPPVGFLKGLPSWRDWNRTRKASLCGAAAALLLLCLYLISPSTPLFEPMGEPLQIVVLGDSQQVPTASVRSLASVARKTAASAEAAPAELEAFKPQAVESFSANPLPVRLAAPEGRPAPTLDRVVTDAGPYVARLMPAEVEQPAMVARPAAPSLGTTAPRRRIAVAAATEATQAIAEKFGQLNVRTDGGGGGAARTYSEYAAAVVNRGPAGAAPRLDNLRSGSAEALQYKPSPLAFERYRGQNIPVARVPEQLSAIAADDGSPTVKLDGNVTQGEAALSFKTGRFRVHGPGTPAEADPATYCYVSKSKEAGKDYLYISFVCSDPNVGALVVNEAGGQPGLAWDDSVEVFLDLNQDRNDYHHIIVNARGNGYSCYCPDGDAGINGRGTAWDSAMKVKTTIDPSAGRWVCEIMVPYDHLPQQPAKGAEVPFNVCRNFRGQHSNNKLQNWFTVYEGAMTNYHHPRLFGKLVWP